VRALQASVFGLPGRHLLTAEPLDDYRRRGLLACDPRTTIDPAVADLLARLARVDAPRCAIGPRLSGEVSQETAAQLYALGFRRFAAETREVRPMVLALGRAALS